ncbi:hypothetical protein ERC79_19555 [Rhodococcus sp. ABRD24]|uniref:hypothetical protein n=1 Tax=Rhodococcus sp. ABRD24 TaxID=2507582 RepID=UPI0010406A46|nr:hypothetical protein [Rhodococcus sp. ABRD24]QBJ97895.1 hypothetical protein ERC79_19555 [Rhodococcus sp. ABRD24]
MKLLVVECLKLGDRARPQESLEDVAKQLAIVHSSSLYVWPGHRERAHKGAAAADGLTAGEDLVERGLTEYIKELIPLNLLGQCEEVRAPPQPSPNVTRYVCTHHPVNRRSRIPPVRNVRQYHEGQEGPD